MASLDSSSSCAFTDQPMILTFTLQTQATKHAVSLLTSRDTSAPRTSGPPRLGPYTHCDLTLAVSPHVLPNSTCVLHISAPRTLPGACKRLWSCLESGWAGGTQLPQVGRKHFHLRDILLGNDALGTSQGLWHAGVSMNGHAGIQLCLN